MSDISDHAIVSEDVKIGKNTVIYHWCNLYGCIIGENTKIGTFVEVQKNVRIGNNCKISSHSFICEGVSIGDNCFIGHGVMFINDRHPKSINENGTLATGEDWILEKTNISDNVSIGTGAIIMCGVNIGANATIGAGAVVTKNVEANKTVIGIPARVINKD